MKSVLSSSRPAANQGAAPAVAPRTLDDLARLAPDALLALYRGARTPKVEELEGPLEGRMLAAPPVHVPVIATLLRWFSASRAFPWQGKTFHTLGRGRGAGINRLAGDRLEKYTFGTSVAPSLAGDFGAVQLDYDRPGNPAPIRAVRDEVRAVAPGLWLGQAYLKVWGRYRLGLYFGLSRPAVPVPKHSVVQAAWLALGLLLPALALALWLARKRGEQRLLPPEPQPAG